MPWARLDDGLNDDAKLSALSDGAYRLWVCGIVYSQKNLTDGFIPEYEVQSFKVREKNRAKLIDELLAPHARIQKGPLWHKVEAGYQMHDYLDWNDSRDKVQAERERAKQRADKFKGRHRPGERSDGVVNAVLNAVSNALQTLDEAQLETLEETRSKHLSTYHVPEVPKKQERAEDDADRFPQAQMARIRTLRRMRSKETDSGKPAKRVITAIARDVIRANRDESDEGELRELLKRECARLNVLYDARSIAFALEEATAQRRKVSA